jgi:hypothetical protein
LSGKRDAVPSGLRIVRYPSGAIEFRLGAKPPKAGDVVMSREGDPFVVESVKKAQDGTFEVTLAEKREPGGSPADLETFSASPAAA